MHPLFALVIAIGAAAFAAGKPKGKQWRYALLSIPVTLVVYVGVFVVAAQFARSI